MWARLVEPGSIVWSYVVIWGGFVERRMRQGQYLAGNILKFHTSSYPSISLGNEGIFQV
jgi:hypothetical protein